MPARTRKIGRRTSKPRPPASGRSAISMVVSNLINMVIVVATSGTVLLGLLAARHF